MDEPIKFVVGFVGGIVMVVLGISAIGGALAVQRLDTAANHVKDIVASNGVYDESTQEEVSGYLQRNSLSAAAVTVSSENGGDVSTMTLGDRFTVMLAQPVQIGVGGIGFTPLELHGKAEGMSEVYRK